MEPICWARGLLVLPPNKLRDSLGVVVYVYAAPARSGQGFALISYSTKRTHSDQALPSENYMYVYVQVHVSSKVDINIENL